MRLASAMACQAVTAITLIATITLVLAALPRGAVSRRIAVARGAAIVALLLVAVVLAANRAYVRKNVSRNEAKVIAEIALRQGIQSERHLYVVARATGSLGNLLLMLRAAQHAPFHWRSPCEEHLGQHIAEPGGPAAGSVEALSAYAVWHGSGRALELSGWAERNGSAADCIVIVDGNRTVIGSGASVSRRPDVERAEGRSLGRIGWKAVATLPQSTPICALALFPNERLWFPLSNCQASIESAEGAPSGNEPAEEPTEPPGP
jgi:hypothetical protein